MKHKQYSDSQLPSVSVVVIGLNVERFLRDCLKAITELDYPSKKLEIIYVDSGSVDGSQGIASTFRNVKILQLDSDDPSAAKGRNAGALAAHHSLIQFVDADSYLHPQWLRRAVEQMGDDVAAVSGRLSERYPDKNLFHRMAELEWNLWVDPKGEWTTAANDANTFGGNVLIRKSTLLAVDG